MTRCNVYKPFQLFLGCAQKRKNHTLPLGDIINEEVIDRELLHDTGCHTYMLYEELCIV